MYGKLIVTADGWYLFQTIEYEGGQYWDEYQPKITKSVTIIIPKTDGMFTEYRGDGNGSCKKITSTKDNRNDLTWTWKYFFRKSTYKRSSAFKDCELKHREGKMQRWEHYVDYSGEGMGGFSSDEKWSMTVKLIDKKGKVALPREFFYEEYDDQSGTTKKNVKLDYNATAAFLIEDYCDKE